MRRPGPINLPARARLRAWPAIPALLFVLALAGPAWAAASGGGDVQWLARVANPSGDSARDVAVSPDGTKVFEAGQEEGPGNDQGYLVVGLDAGTGDLLWTTRYIGPGDVGGPAQAIAVSPDGTRVYVTGASIGLNSGSDVATIALNAASGSIIWIARYGGPGQDEGDRIALSPDGSQLYVAGTSTNANGNFDYATIAYDAVTGEKVWASLYDGPGGGNDFVSGLALSANGADLYVTGGSAGTTSGNDIATLRYNASTGAPVWIRRYDGPGHGRDDGIDVGVSPDGQQVFVTGDSTGTTTGLDIATIAYSRAGKKLWLTRKDFGGGSDFPEALAVGPDGSTVFVTGTVTRGSSGRDYATFAQKASTGAKVWTRFYDGPGGGFDEANDIALTPDGSEVFVTGESQISGSGYDVATLAYTAADGAKRWTNRYDGPVSGDDFGKALAVDPGGARVYVGGNSDSGPPSGSDFLTIAYLS